MNASVSSDRQTFCSLQTLERKSLRNASGLRIDLLPNGTVCSIRHGEVLINQIVGLPPEGAPFRLWLREGPKGASLVGPARTESFEAVNDLHALWRGTWNEWGWTAHLVLHADDPVWAWHVDVRNLAAKDRTADVVMAQDLGLGHVGAVQSNEAYTSHYIDHTIERHDAWGPVLLARQNLGQSGRHPWLAAACTSGGKAYATDAMDVFGLEQRVSGTPRILTGAHLPSARRQGESACLALQSLPAGIAASGSRRFSFSFSYVPDHPGVSSAKDLERVPDAVPFEEVPGSARQPVARSLFDTPDLVHGRPLLMEEWNTYYPDRVNEEFDGDTLWSFFTEEGYHVAAAEKEACLERAHGHVMCGSQKILPEEDAVGTTVYAPGVFNAQIYFGNPNIVRLLTVVRDPFQRGRSCGQRVWVKLNGVWRLLGSPSAFELGQDHARWLYLYDRRTLEVISRVHRDGKTVSLQCSVLEGDPVQWKITHQLALGANELEHPGTAEIDPSREFMKLYVDEASEAAARCPGVHFELSGLPISDLVRLGCDECIWSDGKSRGAPYAVAETAETADFILNIRAASDDGDRALLREGDPVLPPLSWRMAGGCDEARALSGILPWFRYDAWIHLAAPHGLEQYGGAAWGVRDVCQGPVEWLLTEQRYEEIREILKIVFAHQYEASGLWPQWFMLGKYADIQQTHCHGDIMFWPLKALCDYAAAANDLSVLDVEVPYTDGETFQKTARAVPLHEHVDRVIKKYVELCVPGTSLVAYGDGDWDDTLQPALPEMREGMVSTWTVELAYQVFNQVMDLYRRSGRDRAAAELSELVTRIRTDFLTYLMPDGIVSGFSVFKNGGAIPMLHPRDETSGIQYRLLPMIRGIISGLFSPEQARVHRQIIQEHLRFPDGVRLMNRPVPYTGGRSRMFQRAETAAYFGREVSLQYVHAHIRYTEAVMRLGESDEAWWGLQAINPLGLRERLPNAAPRQSNVYFSSSDADVRDRYEAAEKYEEIRTGQRRVKAGWRLYSSGPGLYLHKVRAGLFGVREEYDRIIFDPVMPRHLDGCALHMLHEGHQVQLRQSVGPGPGLIINGVQQATAVLSDNPYRSGGLSIDRSHYRRHLKAGENLVEVMVAKPGPG